MSSAANGPPVPRQMLAPVDTSNMTVTFKLHECFPDSHPTGFVVNCPVPVLAENSFAA